MKGKMQKHNIEGVFVLLLFAVFAVTIVAVLALGANSYRNLVERDNEAYNKRIITSYVSAKIRDNDAAGAVKVGGYVNPDQKDGIPTLHLYQYIDGQMFDMRIYYYQGYIYELFTTESNAMSPEAGNQIVEARGFSLKEEKFAQGKSLIHIYAVDANGRKDSTEVAVRSESGVAP